MTENASNDPRVRRFLREIDEACAGRATSDPPRPDLRDSLLARMRRDIVGIAPTDEEVVLRRIRLGTGC